MTKLLLSLVCIYTISVSHSQTKAGYTPPNFKDKVPAATTFFTLGKIDNVQESNNARLINETTMDKMMRFGKEVSTNIDFISSAEKFTQPNGRVLYQFGIKSKGALSINLILENFYLADDARLFLTDPKSKKYIGAYTSINNNEAEVLGTELINSDEIVLVLDEPANAQKASRFAIKTIVHGFEDLEALAKGLNTSGACHYDVNCSIGTGYELQRNSVAMMVSGGGFCTGTLVHNTSGNIIPYFLSARHCGVTPTSWVFRFRWETPIGQTSCATSSPSGNGPVTMNVNGATLKAQNTNSDFILVQLNSAPDSNWGIYYSGWDNTDSLTATKGIGIHHPDGDIKKISIENNALSQQTIAFNGTQNRTWVITDWDYGATEPGSSGSPLFNQEKRLIGVLSGGNAACSGTTDNNLPDFYGRFGYGWDNSLNPNERLKDWLDPAGTGTTILDGIDPLIGNDTIDASLATLQSSPSTICDSIGNYNFKLMNSGLDTLTSVEILYGFNGLFNYSYSWTGSLPTLGYEIINLSPIAIPMGSNTFSVKIIDANATIDVDSTNNLLNLSIFRLEDDFTAKLALDLDCYGSETSWELKDSFGNTLYYSQPYQDSTQGLYEYQFCLSYGCYEFIVYDQYGDGMSGCSGGDGGNGSYVLSDNSTGTVFAELTENDANFGAVSIKPFCVSATTSLKEYNLENLIELYPNPGSDILNIKTGSTELTQLVVYSYTGQELEKIDAHGNSILLNTKSWPASVYLIKIQTDKGEITKRWVKR
jgi:hypothetical protein